LSLDTLPRSSLAAPTRAPPCSRPWWSPSATCTAARLPWRARC
jgi:hypothetical protein